jgi:hypothetical protein
VRSKALSKGYLFFDENYDKKAVADISKKRLYHFTGATLKSRNFAQVLSSVKASRPVFGLQVVHLAHPCQPESRSWSVPAAQRRLTAVQAGSAGKQT